MKKLIEIFSDLQKFFEYFIERLLWLWLPLYSLYRIAKDVIEEQEAKMGNK